MKDINEIFYIFCLLSHQNLCCIGPDGTSQVVSAAFQVLHSPCGWWPQHWTVWVSTVGCAAPSLETNTSSVTPQQGLWTHCPVSPNFAFLWGLSWGFKEWITHVYEDLWSVFIFFSFPLSLILQLTFGIFSEKNQNNLIGFVTVNHKWL